MNQEFIGGRISLIIPVYNCEQYIARCVNSILNQSYSDYEILLIDDGSSDNTASICDEFSERDHRIRTFHINNGGVSNARNYALDKITGEWFGFIDADDWIETNYLEILYDNALNNECSVSGCSYSVDYSYSISDITTCGNVVVLENSEQCIANFICPGISLNGMVWSKIYKSEIYAEVRFNTQLKVNEDCIYTYDLLEKCNRACVTADKLYHWFTRDDSACHKKPDTLDFSRADVFLDLLSRTSHFCDDTIRKTLERNYINSVVNILFYVEYDNSEEQVCGILRTINEWKEDVWNLLNRNQKIKFLLVTRYSWMLAILRKVRK